MISISFFLCKRPPLSSVFSWHKYCLVSFRPSAFFLRNRKYRYLPHNLSHPSFFLFFLLSIQLSKNSTLLHNPNRTRKATLHHTKSPWNPLASFAMVAQLHALTGVQAILGYNFVNANTLWLALQAAGSGVGGSDGNKVQAMLGDSILKLILIDNLSAAGHTRSTSSIICIPYLYYSIDTLVSSRAPHSHPARIYRRRDPKYRLEQQPRRKVHRHGNHPIHQRQPIPRERELPQDQGLYHRSNPRSRIHRFRKKPRNSPASHARSGLGCAQRSCIG